jgi:hypothetical protein
MKQDYRRIKEQLIERDGIKCSLCGVETNHLYIDHILPKSLVNNDDLENLQLLCQTCNAKKSNKIISERQFQDFLAELILENDDFRNTEVEPAMKDKNIRLDIVTEMKSEDQWLKTIIEVKSFGSYTNDNLKRIAEQLLYYKSFYKNYKLVLAFPGVMTDEGKKILKENGIDIWDKKRIENIFAETLHKTNRSFLNMYYKKKAKPVVSIGQSLIAELDSIKPGKDNGDWQKYQNHVEKILDYLFGDSLSSPITEHSDHWKVNRRDFILRNYAESGFWAQIRNRYYADFIVLDAKNYSKKITKKEILQITNYLKIHGTGLFGVIISRNGGDRGSYITAREYWAMENKMVIVLNDNDVKNMILAKESGNLPEEILRQKIEEFRLSM